MDWFFNINYCYKLGTWKIERVKRAVELNKITETQYKEITSEDYTK